MMPDSRARVCAQRSLLQEEDGEETDKVRCAVWPDEISIASIYTNAHARVQHECVAVHSSCMCVCTCVLCCFAVCLVLQFNLASSVSSFPLRVCVSSLRIYVGGCGCSSMMHVPMFLFLLHLFPVTLTPTQMISQLDRLAQQRFNRLTLPCGYQAGVD